VVVRDVQPITINTTDHGQAEVILGTHRLTIEDLAAFARSEGFDGVRQFAEFFYEKHGPNPTGLYHIRWKDG
jgi:hypothetical protein